MDDSYKIVLISDNGDMMTNSTYSVNQNMFSTIEKVLRSPGCRKVASFNFYKDSYKQYNDEKEELFSYTKDENA